MRLIISSLAVLAVTSFMRADPAPTLLSGSNAAFAETATQCFEKGEFFSSQNALLSAGGKIDPLAKHESQWILLPVRKPDTGNADSLPPDVGYSASKSGYHWPSATAPANNSSKPKVPDWIGDFQTVHERQMRKEYPPFPQRTSGGNTPASPIKSQETVIQ